MSDSRDTNHDGKVSFVEKVKGALHIGQNKDTNAEYASTHHTAATTTTGHSADLNHDGHVSAAERVAASGGAYSSGAHSSGVHSTGTGVHSTGVHSTGVHSGAHASGAHLNEEETRLRLHEEQLAIGKQQVGAGEVDIHKRIHSERVQQTVPVTREEVTVEHRPLHGLADPNARIAEQDEVLRVPLHREELVTEKRVVPTEEVIVRKRDVTEHQNVEATLRSEHVETRQHTDVDAHGSALHHNNPLSPGTKRKGETALGAGYDDRDAERL